jgi:hypothetical protein
MEFNTITNHALAQRMTAAAAASPLLSERPPLMIKCLVGPLAVENIRQQLQTQLLQLCPTIKHLGQARYYQLCWKITKTRCSQAKM